MGDTTGIEWTDSTMNFWEGCTKVGPGCDHCYAETRDIRYHQGSHWGSGALRRQMSEHTRHNLRRWQKGAAEFIRLRGYPQKVFCSSLSDIFDNEVPGDWRENAWDEIEIAPDLRLQLCTKRIGNVPKMVRESWKTAWPQHVGILITVVTQAEADRDIPKLIRVKEEFGVPWVGLSVEPLIEDIDLTKYLPKLDWVIIGGESGSQARQFDYDWCWHVVRDCTSFLVPVFVKQMGELFTIHGNVADVTGKGKDMAEWPAPIRVRQFPTALTT